MGNFPDGLEDPGAFLARPETHLRASQPALILRQLPTPPQPSSYEWGEAWDPQGATWLGLRLDQSLESGTGHRGLWPSWAVSWRATQCG